MSTNVAEIEAKILSLSLEDKTELLRLLIAELDGPVDADVEKAWLREAQRRHREIEHLALGHDAPGQPVHQHLSQVASTFFAPQQGLERAVCGGNRWVHAGEWPYGVGVLKRQSPSRLR